MDPLLLVWCDLRGGVELVSVEEMIEVAQRDTVRGDDGGYSGRASELQLKLFEGFKGAGSD